MRETALGYVLHDLLLVPSIHMALPRLENVVNDLRGCISLEKLRVVVGLCDEIAQAVEGSYQLGLLWVANLQSACNV